MILTYDSHKSVDLLLFDSNTSLWLVYLKTCINCLNFETIIKNTAYYTRLQTVYSHQRTRRMFTESYLGIYRISTMEVFSKRLLAPNHSCKKTPSLVLDRVLMVYASGLYNSFIFYTWINTEAATRRSSVKKVS